ncbi:MAG: glycosyltransferase family 2 protein [Actinomycetota bacterium]|nr:glycosyltransferase family 2 protein [Actinomycetota bacterium]
MDLLRLFGLLVAVTLLILAVRRYRRRALRLPDALIMAALSLGLAVVALAPSIVDPVLRELGFPPGDARRVIGVLVLSNILTYVLLLRSFAKTDRLEQLLGDHADRLAARWFQQEYGDEARSVMGPRKVAVVIPALNEEDSLGKVLSLIPDEIAGLEVERIVVSDGSTDATERVARDHRALVVGRDVRRGQGAAVALGYKVAIRRGADVVATLDADGQYDPLELPQLIQPILDGDADVVHGSRMLGEYERPLFGRAQGLRVFAWLTSVLSRTQITDPASGFRAFTPEALRVLEFRENQFHASEVTVAAAKLGLSVKEVPCTFSERWAGSTKKPPIIRYGYGYARTLLRTWLG